MANVLGREPGFFIICCSCWYVWWHLLFQPHFCWFLSATSTHPGTQGLTENHLCAAHTLLEFVGTFKICFRSLFQLITPYPFLHTCFISILFQGNTRDLFALLIILRGEKGVLLYIFFSCSLCSTTYLGAAHQLANE